jgi:hypothetical protein
MAGIVMTPITQRRLDEIKGSLRPSPGEPSAFDALFEERERERKREDLKCAVLAGLQGDKIEIPVAEIRKKGLVAALRKRVRRK